MPTALPTRPPGTASIHLFRQAHPCYHCRYTGIKPGPYGQHVAWHPGGPARTPCWRAVGSASRLEGATRGLVAGPPPLGIRTGVLKGAWRRPARLSQRRGVAAGGRSGSPGRRPVYECKIPRARLGSWRRGGEPGPTPAPRLAPALQHRSMYPSPGKLSVLLAARPEARVVRARAAFPPLPPPSAAFPDRQHRCWPGY